MVMSSGTEIGEYSRRVLSNAIELGSPRVALEISEFFWIICAVLLFFTVYTIEKDNEKIPKHLERTRKEMVR